MEPFMELNTGTFLRCQGTCKPKNKSNPGKQCKNIAEFTTGYCATTPPHLCMPDDGVLPLQSWPEAWVNKKILHPNTPGSSAPKKAVSLTDINKMMKQ